MTATFIVPVALKEVMEALLPVFEKATGQRVEVSVMLNPDVPAHIAGGAMWDIAMTNPWHVEEIVAAGHGARGSHRPFGRAPLAFGTPDVPGRVPSRAGHDIAALLLEAESIAVTRTGTSGKTFRRLVEALGLGDALEPKLRLLGGGEPMAALLAGEVAVAALPLTNIAPVIGVSAAAICPVAFDVHIDLSLCVSPMASDTALALVDWLLDPGRDAALSRLGAERFSLASGGPEPTRPGRRPSPAERRDGT